MMGWIDSFWNWFTGLDGVTQATVVGTLIAGTALLWTIVWSIFTHFSSQSVVNNGVSWKRASEEIIAMQDVFDARLREELAQMDRVHGKEHLETAKTMKLEQVDMWYDFTILRATVDQIMTLDQKRQAIEFLREAMRRGAIKSTDTRVLNVFRGMIHRDETRKEE